MTKTPYKDSLPPGFDIGQPGDERMVEAIVAEAGDFFCPASTTNDPGSSGRGGEQDARKGASSADWRSDAAAIAEDLDQDTAADAAVTAHSAAVQGPDGLVSSQTEAGACASAPAAFSCRV